MGGEETTYLVFWEEESEHTRKLRKHLTDSLSPIWPTLVVFTGVCMLSWGADKLHEDPSRADYCKNVCRGRKKKRGIGGEVGRKGGRLRRSEKNQMSMNMGELE